MTEYIDREALRKAIKENMSNLISRSKNNLYVIPRAKFGELADAIADKVPAADVVEVKRGRWEIITDDFDCELMHCSVCGEEWYDGDSDTVDRLFKYCPNCGAKMED